LKRIGDRYSCAGICCSLSRHALILRRRQTQQSASSPTPALSPPQTEQARTFFTLSGEIEFFASSSISAGTTGSGLGWIFRLTVSPDLTMTESPLLNNLDSLPKSTGTYCPVCGELRRYGRKRSIQPTESTPLPGFEPPRPHLAMRNSGGTFAREPRGGSSPSPCSRGRVPCECKWDTRPVRLFVFLPLPSYPSPHSMGREIWPGGCRKFVKICEDSPDGLEQQPLGWGDTLTL
jgi:hypothetical protein